MNFVQFALVAFRFTDLLSELEESCDLCKEVLNSLDELLPPAKVLFNLICCIVVVIISTDSLLPAACEDLHCVCKVCIPAIAVALLKLCEDIVEELLYEDNFNVEGSDGADSEMYKKELKVVIAQAIDALKPKEKQVVTLYYYEKLKFSEIASVLQVSESRVCQIHSKAMLVLKHSLQDYMTR